MITDNFRQYIENLNWAYSSINMDELDAAVRTILRTINLGGKIYVCGNGGSAAIADHFCCDCLKGVREDSGLITRVVSLSSNGPLLSAIANDLGYENTFSYQIYSLANPGDIVLTVSSSGNSPNIKKAIETARSIPGVTTIAMSGFDGGASLDAHISLHVKSHSYQIVEDTHQSLCHFITNELKLSKNRVDTNM